MNSIAVFILVLSICGTICSGKQRRYLPKKSFDDDDVLGFQNFDDDEIQARGQVIRKERGAFDCKQKYEQCSGIIACCGSYQCFWPDGYSLTKSGRCVDCVQRHQKCQRDSQCCQGLVCHKGSRYYVDGQCAEKRYTGAECHEDSQCRSGNCNTTVGQKLKGYGGACT